MVQQKIMQKRDTWDRKKGRQGQAEGDARQADMNFTKFRSLDVLPL